MVWIFFLYVMEKHGQKEKHGPTNHGSIAVQVATQFLPGPCLREREAFGVTEVFVLKAGAAL